MEFNQLLTMAGLMAAILGICIAVAQYFNGKHIKSGVKEIKEEVNKVLSKMDEGFNRMDDRAEQRHKEVTLALSQQHQDVIALIKNQTELMKMGFCEVHTRMDEEKKHK